MTQDDFFDLSLEEDFDSLNPLADFNPDEDDDFDSPIESGVIRTDPREFPTMEELAQRSSDYQQLPAAQRADTLFDNMKSFRKVLMAVLTACMESQPNEDLLQLVAK